ncbi:MAG: glycosyltransferase family 39 protein [Myxococcota bacterium]
MNRSTLIVAVWLALSILHLGLSTRSDPGVYYDEVIQAVPALDYLRGFQRVSVPPQVTAFDLYGRPLPWMTQPYMGALKSQLLIPSFALFGATPDVLRITTTVWGLLAIGLAMLFTRRLFGTGAACVAGTLLAVDPTWLFVARHDWGSVSLALLCRMGALLLVLRAWDSGRKLEAAAAGLVAGLAVYNKVDAVPFLAAATIAGALARPDAVRGLLGPRWRLLAWAAAGAVVGALPLILSAARILDASGRLSDAAGLTGRIAVARATLDGSYFHRLIDTGGVFEALSQVDAPSWPLPMAGLAGLGVLTIWVLRGPRSAPATRGALFLLLAALGTEAGLLALPAADRVHHALNVYPLPHLAVAGAGLFLWRRWDAVGALPRAGRAGLLALLALLAAMGLRVIDRTADLVEQTGGRGLWSDATTRLAASNDRSETTFVCLDWGFQQSLAFQTERARIVDAVWKLRWGHHQIEPWTLRGDTDHVYLLHEGDTAVFGLGEPFLEAARALPSDRVEIESWEDREGSSAFVSVRILGPHVVRYRDRYDIDLL